MITHQTAAPTTPPPPSSTSLTPMTLAPRASSWQLYEGLNCYGGVGGAIVGEGQGLVDFDLSLTDCQAACKARGECEGVLVVRGENPGRCWLRKDVDPSKCIKNTAWDLWFQVQGAAGSTTSPPPSSTSHTSLAP